MRGVKIERVINVNGRRFSDPKLAADAVGTLIASRIYYRMSQKLGHQWHNDVDADHINGVAERARRRVLPICESMLEGDD